ncbi:MAG: hypothetical protein OHK0015_02400 [Chloroflexi bacterium OHK40]
MGRLARHIWLRIRPSLRSAHFSPSVAAIIVLTLAILNPLACVIHCATLDARALQAHTHGTGVEAGAAFLCELSALMSQPPTAVAAEQISLPLLAVSSLPRAVYEGVALAAFALPLLVLLVGFRPPRATPIVSYRTSPPCPPPRAA